MGFFMKTFFAYNVSLIKINVKSYFIILNCQQKIQKNLQ